MTGTPIIPPNLNDVPLLKRLFVDIDKSGGLQQQFYELRFEVDRATQTLNSLRKQGRMDELDAYRSNTKGVLQVKGQVRALERYMDNWRKKRDNCYKEMIYLLPLSQTCSEQWNWRGIGG